MLNILDDLKREEGFSSTPYEDTNGFLTVGYGTKIDKISYGLAECMLEYMLNEKREELLKRRPIMEMMPDEVQNILFQMAYQMGVEGLLGFKYMWKALALGDYEEASDEMLDSKWAKHDSPSRAKRLAERMKDVNR